MHEVLLQPCNGEGAGAFHDIARTMNEGLTANSCRLSAVAYRTNRSGPETVWALKRSGPTVSSILARGVVVLTVVAAVCCQMP